MASQQVRRFLRPVGNPADPAGLFQWMQRYLAHIQARGYTLQTRWDQERYLRDFIAWCDGRGLERPEQIEQRTLEAYLLHLQNYRKRNGEALSWLSKQDKVIPLRSFFRWLARIGTLDANPAEDLTLGRAPERLQADTLKPWEGARLLAQPDVGSPGGIRDRAMLETLFSTGIRRMELAGLRVGDVDPVAQTLFVHRGKGGKDRLIPIGRSALQWIDRYIREVRPLRAGPLERALFLTREGKPFNLAWLGTVIGGYVRKAFPSRRGACHLLRHTMATLMLDEGADIRYVQEMLGHAQLSTTQIYTRVSIERLQAVHANTTPGGWAGGDRHRERTLLPTHRAAGSRSTFRRRAHALVDRLPPTAGWLDLIYLASAKALGREKSADS